MSKIEFIVLFTNWLAVRDLEVLFKIAEVRGGQPNEADRDFYWPGTTKRLFRINDDQN